MKSRSSLGGLRGFGYFSWFWYHELPKLEKEAAEVQITEQNKDSFCDMNSFKRSAIQLSICWALELFVFSFLTAF